MWANLFVAPFHISPNTFGLQLQHNQVLFSRFAGTVSVYKPPDLLACHGESFGEKGGKGGSRWGLGWLRAPGREAISQLVCSLGSQAENAADLWSKLKWCQCRNKAAS